MLGDVSFLLSVPLYQQLQDFLCHSVSGLLLCLCRVLQRDSHRRELDIDDIYRKHWTCDNITAKSIGLKTIYIYC